MRRPTSQQGEEPLSFAQEEFLMKIFEREVDSGGFGHLSIGKFPIIHVEDHNIILKDHVWIDKSYKMKHGEGQRLDYMIKTEANNKMIHRIKNHICISTSNRN